MERTCNGLMKRKFEANNSCVFIRKFWGINLITIPYGYESTSSGFCLLAAVCSFLMSSQEFSLTFLAPSDTHQL